MKTLPWTFFILGMLLYAAVWWATDVEAGEAGYIGAVILQDSGT